MLVMTQCHARASSIMVLIFVALCVMMADGAAGAITSGTVDAAIRLVQEELNVIYNRYEVTDSLQPVHCLSFCTSHSN